MNTTRQVSSKRHVQRLDGRQHTLNQGNGDSVRETEEDEGISDDVWPPRLPNSTVRRDLQAYQQANTRYQFHPDQVQRIPRRSSAEQVSLVPRGRATEEEERKPRGPTRRQRGWFRSHPLLWVGFGMLFMLVVWQGLTALGNWWTLHQQDATYGRPRTAQYDVVVGHNDSSAHPTHFIAVNLNSTVVVIEIPGGDTSKAKIYQGPQLFGPNAALDPVTLSFRDVNGDGRIDMIVNVQGAAIIFLNQNGQFVAQTAH